MQHGSRAPYIENQLRFLLVGVTCSFLPTVLIIFLPDPLHTSLVPLAALLGAYGLMFGLALVLYGFEWAWCLLRRPTDVGLRCPVCHTVEQSYRTFFVDRVAPALFRVHCPECHERWIERR